VTTFKTCFGRYRWRSLPFGICVASEIFQKRLIQTLDILKNVIYIADDIIIHGEDAETHDDNLDAFLRRYQDVGIKLKKEKLELHTDNVTFLGHRISSGGLEADPKKVEIISCMEPPTNLHQLRTYIGMANYMAKLSPHLSETMKPLTNLSKSNVPSNWSSAEQQTFDEIKSLLTKAHVLTFYDTG